MPNPSKFSRDQIITIALAVMLLCDLTFTALHLVHVETWRLPSRDWSLEQDRGYAEWWQYAKYLVLIGLLLVLAARRRTVVLLGWACVFTLMLLDDSLRFHERFGVFIASTAHLPSFGRLRGRDIGEILFAALAGIVVLPMLIAGYVRGTRESRELTQDFAIMLVAIVACGVVIDTLHRFVANRHLDALVTMIEDGGEMLLLSAAVFYAMQWLGGRDAVRYRPAQIVATFLMRMRARLRARDAEM